MAATSRSGPARDGRRTRDTPGSELVFSALTCDNVEICVSWAEPLVTCGTLSVGSPPDIVVTRVWFLHR